MHIIVNYLYHQEMKFIANRAVDFQPKTELGQTKDSTSDHHRSSQPKGHAYTNIAKRDYGRNRSQSAKYVPELAGIYQSAPVSGSWRGYIVGSYVSFWEGRI
jgi:hypothetical protein